MNTVMNNLLDVLNFHSNQYSLIKQGKNIIKKIFIDNIRV
jgi:hypothetical protein